MLGILTAVSLILGLVESFIPLNFSGVPGIKLGLSNIAVLLAVYIFGKKEGAAVLIAKVLLSLVLFSGISGFIYSACGAALSFSVICFLYNKKSFTPIGVSAASASAHNTGQITAAFLLTKSVGLFWYLPLLMIFGAALGSLTGFLTLIILNRIKKTA